MIRSDGTIHFADELLNLVDRFVEDYQDIEGPIQSEFDRALVVAYALCAMRCDLELLGESVRRERVFGNLNPQRILDECSEASPETRAVRLQEAAQALAGHGYLADEGNGDDPEQSTDRS